MKRFLWISLCLVIAACTPAVNVENAAVMQEDTFADAAIDLPDFGPAPELNTDTWLNTDQVLRLADLKGKVVLLEMWTFACINCKNVVPSLKDWHSRYVDEGLVIIGNHYPEFSFEAELENLEQALIDQGIEYAVTQDNEGKNWRAYENRYWPTLYLIDKTGRIRYKHIGEGNYETTEKVIKQLLAE